MRTSSATPRIRVMLVDDHFALRAGLATTLSIEPDIDIVAEADTGTAAITAYRTHQPDVVVMDYHMPGCTGVEAIAAIRAEFPTARIMILSAFEGEEDLFNAHQAGAMGYLLKSADRADVVKAIRALHRGQRYYPPALATMLEARLNRPSLSERETEVLRLIVSGKANKEIATTLSLAEITVKNHITHILEKLGVQDRTQAAIAALQRGIVRL